MECKRKAFVHKQTINTYLRSCLSACYEDTTLREISELKQRLCIPYMQTFDRLIRLGIETIENLEIIIFPLFF